MHWDCEGHGGTMFLVKQGAVSSYSRKVKSNKRSLPNTKLVTADIYMPGMLRSFYFMQSQGCNVEWVELYQDTQLLMKNEIKSIKKCTIYTTEIIDIESF
jgi:hypothetical protein